VLAHVSETAHYASSLHDAAYVRFAEGILGPASERQLGDDAALLARLLHNHDELVRVQLLAWLFQSREALAKVVSCDLSTLEAADVDAPELLPALRAAGPAAEVLRAAVEIEAAAHARLPEPELDHDGLRLFLERLLVVAPRLSASRVSVVRALGRRGRVRGREIWVGAVFAGGPTTAHLGWQAAHEATVAELAEAASSAVAERAIEHAAIVLLAERSRRAALVSEHAQWFGHFRGNAPDPALAALNPELQALVGSLLASSE